jgi:hypothetical protein
VEYYVSSTDLDEVERLAWRVFGPPHRARKPPPRANDGFYSYAEIAAELGCTRQNVQAIERRALKKLRYALERLGYNRSADFY